MSHSLWTVYMLLCSNGAYYTGISTNVSRRLREHAKGKGSKYVRSHLPFQLVYEGCAGKTRSSAQKVEHRIKRMSHEEKASLAEFYLKLVSRPPYGED